MPRIAECFHSIQGEGVSAGVPCVFRPPAGLLGRLPLV